MGDKMDTYIKGRFFKIIYEGDRGYVVGLFKVIETNIDNLKNKINKTIIFTGYFHDLIKGDCLPWVPAFLNNLSKLNATLGR